MQLQMTRATGLQPASGGLRPVPVRVSPCRLPHIQTSRASSSTGASTSSQLSQPEWTGDKLLSRLVNFLIGTPPIYEAMKVLAKMAMKSSADAKGVGWDEQVRQLQATSELHDIKAEIENPDIKYPDYYLQPFHAYTEGNMNWLAAYEVEAATYAMSIRTFRHLDLAKDEAYNKVRGGIAFCLSEYRQQHQLAVPRDVLDMGCSVGMSSRHLRDQFPDAKITGLDLSPYFLAIAEYRERQQPQGIKYVHRLAESTGYPDASFDLVTIQYVFHECPEVPIREITAEARRVLRPGGVMMMVDNNPRSKTIQNLPPALFTLMKSTEPWSDQYYSLDQEEVMRGVGFRDVVTMESDHRHRAVFGIAEAR